MNFDIIFVDLKGILTDFRPRDLGPYFFWAMWLSIVFASLRGVDRRDEIAQVTYMGVVAAFGVLFLLVFPVGRPPKYSPEGQIILFLVLLMAPSLRWLMRRRITDLDRRLQSANIENGKK